MTLTAEQIAIRRTGVGASEVSAITRTSVYAEPIDVWLAKKGLADFPESEAMIVGTELEGPLADIYARRTGRRVERPFTTYRHPEFEHVLASPDGIVNDGERGLEIKVVGARMAHHWSENSMPDYVVDQARQNMAVLDLDHWDVCALIGGNEIRIETVEREYDHEGELLEACEVFWAVHVEADEAPEVDDPEKRRAYILARYPGSEKTAALDVSSAPDAEEIAEAIRWYRTADEMSKLLKVAKDELRDMICARIGADYGITGPWGKFLHYPRRGDVDWQAVARELSPSIPAELIEKHRGDPTRVPRFYPPSKGTTTKKGSKR